MNQMIRKLLFVIVAVVMIVGVIGCSPSLPSHVPTLTIVLQADLSKLDLSKNDNAMKRAISIISRRLDVYGVIRPIVQQQGSNHILVQLPGFTDIEVAKRLVQTGFLEFREVELNEEGKPVYLNDYLESSVNDFFNKKETGKRLFVNEGGEAKDYGKPIAFLVKDEKGLSFTDINGNPIDRETLKQGPVQAPAWILARGDDGPPLTGAYLSDASPDIQQGVTGGQPEVNIKWNAEGSIIFDQIAKRLYNPQEAYSLEHVLGIFLDNALISAPQIRAQVFHGTGVISGSFTVDSATELANLLKSGSLPVPFNIVEWHID